MLSRHTTLVVVFLALWVWGGSLPELRAQVVPGLIITVTPRLDRLPNLIRVPLVRQATDFTCGVSALQSVLAYYGRDIRDDKLRQALGSTPETGTDIREMFRFTLGLGFHVQLAQGMTLTELKQILDRKTPVILPIQAWPKKRPVDWANDWEDGHYVVAVGYDVLNVYFMDPATIGDYTYIPIPEFLTRWHDRDQNGAPLIQAGLVIDSKPRAYDPNRIRRLN